MVYTTALFSDAHVVTRFHMDDVDEETDSTETGLVLIAGEEEADKELDSACKRSSKVWIEAPLRIQDFLLQLAATAFLALIWFSLEACVWRLLPPRRRGGAASDRLAQPCEACRLSATDYGDGARKTLFSPSPCRISQYVN